MNVCSANEEIVKVKRSSESDVARLQAAARKAEMQVQSLEQTIEQKASSCSAWLGLASSSLAFLKPFKSLNVFFAVHSVRAVLA